MENVETIDIELKSKFSVLETYGENLANKQYITNPAIERDEEIKKLIMVLLTPDKSGLLVGKPGIGKTAIVEGLAYLIQKNEVPNVLKEYKVIKFNSASLVGTITTDGREELIMNIFVEELKQITKTIVFIDEIHTLIGSKDNGPMDLANILKPGLDRGDIKAIGATTTIEYETYVVRDRAFLRRFERVDVLEPDVPTTIKILYGSLAKIEKNTGIKFISNDYIAKLLIESIVEATTEYKRVYGLSAMYPDVAFSILSSSFSQALFNNKNEVSIEDVYNAIKTSKRIYPDSIIKELIAFKEKFLKYTTEMNIYLPDVKIEEITTSEDII